ncbi:phosphatidylinositol transfer protein csr1 [Coemansia thaxteri]|nr:phosphatidylinositol transfer protein csr1 [Coemansia thaxteri]
MAPAETSPSLLEHYARRLPLTEGRLPLLPTDQAAKLRRLWLLLLREFDTAPALPVLFSLAHSQETVSSEASEDSAGLAAISFEPLVSLGSKPTEPRGTPPLPPSSPDAPRPRPVNGASSNGWLGWMSSSRSSTASDSGSVTPAPPPVDNTPTEDNAETARQRTETVQDYVSRMSATSTYPTAVRADVAPAAAPLVPPNFTPLFGQPALTRSFRATFWQAATQMRDPDAWVLRFLRARKWDVDQALDMIKKTLVWRAGQAIDEIAYYGESKLHYHTMDTGLAYACTMDRLGCPVFVVRVRANIARNRNIVAIKRFLCWQLETSQLLAADSDGRVTILFDMTGFTRENIDLDLVRTLISLLSSYFPETLGIMILHVNSWVFTGLWAIISPFIDPVVKSKIVMVRSAQEIAPFIDPDQLVSELGGKKQFNYTYVLPTSQENADMADTAARQAAEHDYVSAVASYEQITRQWLNQPQSGSNLDPARCAARDALHSATAMLDPYVRSRTLYHRLGQIKPDRSVLF